VLELIRDAFHTLYNLSDLIRVVGLAGLAAVIFAETGLLCFFLPGDSLLVTAGVFAASGMLDIATLNLLLIAAAIGGDAVGFWIGYRAGRPLFSRPDSLIFRREHLVRTHEFYERHGGKTIIIARFMPIVRTFAPVVAGIGTMRYAQFASYNIVGGIAWVASMTLGGYFLGRSIPNIEQNIQFVIAIVIVLSLLPAAIAWWRDRGKKKTEQLRMKNEELRNTK
jgi:membrane-associated protein